MAIIEKVETLSENPVEYIERKIRDRKLSDYIKRKECSELMRIYEVDLPGVIIENRRILGFEKDRVVAADSETAIWYYLIREDPNNARDAFRNLCESYGYGNEKRGISLFASQIGVIGL